MDLAKLGSRHVTLMNKYKRQSGVLLHPSALPGPYGIGDIGPQAYSFVDHLSEMGQTLWQILPIGPTDFHNSPYSSMSTFAGNHLLISLDLLVEDGLLASKILEGYQAVDLHKIIYNDVINFKLPILKEVAQNFNNKASVAIKISFEQFCMDQSYWLDDYSRYWALKVENDHKSWSEWKLNTVQNTEHVHEAKVMQFLFHNQWHRLRQYCLGKGIQVIGDMPIYVGYDSADVYANPELFQLDGEGRMIYQGGCPPCEYQEKGQLWGSPLYNWKNHEKTNFEWWQRRFKKLFEMVDIIRLDHFIGYTKYYKVPMEDQTAQFGRWMQAPGDKLFKVLDSTIMDFNVIVEDLGDVTEDIICLREKYDFPSMRVLQFEFGQMSLLKDLPKNSVVYTGTHDNDTLLGWFESLPAKSSVRGDLLTQNKLLQFLKCTKEDIIWETISYALSTASYMVIMPLQDILGENSLARFNTPGTLSPDNWSWRMEDGKLTRLLKTKLAELTEDHNRNTSAVINLLKKEIEY